MGSQWLDYCKTFIPQIKARHKQMLGRDCDLNNPKRFTDKLEWLKVYDSTFLKTYCADKLTVRKYVSKKLGKYISFPVLGIYDTFDSIEFAKLPTDYVIKTNHGSHTNIIVRNGNINKVKARQRFTEWLSKDWSWWGYELLYIPIPRKIFIEPLMTDGHNDLTDYKFLCFNGVPRYCQVISDRNNSDKRLNYYDLNWSPMYKICRTDFRSNYNLLDSKPSNFNQMIEYATKLSAEFKFVRVDFYEINGVTYFGELTFIPGAAYIQYTSDNIDYEFGNFLML